MSTLSRQRCANHLQREAVARCPSCGRFFCRECVTEHDDRLLCSSCISKITTQSEQKSYIGVGRALLFFSAIFSAWLFFYWMGELLLLLPTAFHEGTFWQTIAK